MQPPIIDSSRFYMLDNIRRIDYIRRRMQDAKYMYKIINEGFVPLTISEVNELRTLGDTFVSVGISAEDGEFDGLFEKLEKAVARLEELAEKVYNGSFN